MFSYRALFYTSLVSAIIWSGVAFYLPGNTDVQLLALFNTGNCIYIDWLRTKHEEAGKQEDEK